MFVLVRRLGYFGVSGGGWGMLVLVGEAGVCCCYWGRLGYVGVSGGGWGMLALVGRLGYVGVSGEAGVCLC